MADNKVSIEISAEIKSALKNFETLQKEASDSLSSIASASKKSFEKVSSGLGTISSGFKLLGGAAVAAAGVFAGRAVVGAFDGFVNAAAEAQQSLQNLNTAMALSGSFTEEASQAFVDFASEIQRTTKFEDDLVISQLAVAKSFGISNEQAQKLVQAAVELSSVTGDSLQSSVEQLGKTFSGTTGLLSKSRPELRGLSEEALKSGAAIDAVLKALGGSAALQVQTFSGAMAQAKNIFGQFGETIGSVIVDNPAVVAAIGAVSKIVSALTDQFVKIVPALKDFIADLIVMSFEAIPNVIDTVRFLGNGFLLLREVFLNLRLAVLSTISSFLDFKIIKQVFKSVFDAVKDQILFAVSLFEAFIDILSQLPGAGKFLKPISKGINDIGNNIADLNAETAFDGLKDGIDSLAESTAASLNESDALFKSFNDGADSAKKFTRGLADEVKKVGTNAANTADNFKKISAAANAARGAASGAAPAPANEAKPAPAPAPANEAKPAAKEQGDAFGFEVLQSIQAGADLFRDIFGEGLISSFTNFVRGLGELPKAFVEATKQLDEVITGILEALPEVIQTLTEQVPALFDKITEALPKLVEAIIPAIQKIAEIIAEKAPALAAAILEGVTKLVDALPKIIDTLLDGLPALFSAILKKLPALITAIARAIPQIFRSIFEVIPLLVQELAANIGPIVLAFVQGFLEAMPQIVLDFVDVFITKGGIFKIVGALIASMPDIAVALVQGIVRAGANTTEEVGRNIGNAAGTAFTQVAKIELPPETRDVLTGKLFVDKIKENAGQIKDLLSGKLFTDKLRNTFDRFSDQLRDILSGGLSKGGSGGAGGILSRATGGVKLATGGQVLSVPLGYPNDTYPALLSSRELVIDHSTTDALKAYLAQNESRNVNQTSTSSLDLESMFARMAQLIDSRPVNVSLTLNEQQLATAVYNAGRRGYRI